MKNVVTLFEHETATFDLTERDLTMLAQLNQAGRSEILRPVVSSGKIGIQATQYVGVVRLRRRTIQILPKMYRSNIQAQNEATRNLLHLLAYAGQIPIREQALASLLRRNSDWFEILTRLFALHLAEEWQRGAYHCYRSVEDDLPVLKGRWRITDQLRRPERRHSFAVTYDEFSADNPLNQVLRFVVERLWQLTRDPDNRRRLGELRQWLDEVTLLPAVSVTDADPKLLTRLNQRYAPLLNLARMFLDGGVLQLAAGDHSTFAFVFDMNRLFEAFLVNFIARHREVILPSALHNCTLLPQAQSTTCFLAQTNGQQVFRLKPDLVFRDGSSFPLLLDAKYKILTPSDRKLGITHADFYQMHAYAQRYDSPHVLLLYPQTAAMPLPLTHHFTLEGSTGKTIIVATVDVRGELGKAEERQRLMQRLRTLVKTEE